MAVESSSIVASTSSSGSKSLSWKEIHRIISPWITPEPYFFYDNHKYTDMNPIFQRIRNCNGFHKVVVAKPDRFLPNHIAALLYLFWHELNPEDLSYITLYLTTTNIEEPEVSVLEANKKTFNLDDAGDVSLDNIPLKDLQAIYEVMVLPSEKPEERTYQLKMFLHAMLKLANKLLFDVVYRVFMS